MFKIESRFSRYEKVGIVELERNGLILEIIYDGELLYKIGYWNNGEQKTCYCRDFEIQKMK
jgi:hypothetical protein